MQNVCYNNCEAFGIQEVSSKETRNRMKTDICIVYQQAYMSLEVNPLRANHNCSRRHS